MDAIFVCSLNRYSVGIYTEKPKMYVSNCYFNSEVSSALVVLFRSMFGVYCVIYL